MGNYNTAKKAYDISIEAIAIAKNSGLNSLMPIYHDLVTISTNLLVIASKQLNHVREQKSI